MMNHHKNMFLQQVYDEDSVPNIVPVLLNTNSGSNDIASFSARLEGNRTIISVAAQLDYETKNQFNFALTTTEGQNSNEPYTTAVITVHVTVSRMFLVTSMSQCSISDCKK